MSDVVSAMAGDLVDDEAEIAALVERQMANLSWSPDRPADFAAFAADFAPGAALYPASMPGGPHTVEAFVERMKARSADLASFTDRVLVTGVEVFGKVATAVATVETTEGDGPPVRSVDMLLLVKLDGAWRIAAQAWDVETDGRPIPERLLPA